MIRRIFIFAFLLVVACTYSFAGYKGSKRVTVGSHFFVNGTYKNNIYAVLWYYDPAYVQPAEIITGTELNPEFLAITATPSAAYTTVQCVIYYYDSKIGKNMEYYDSWNVFITANGNNTGTGNDSDVGTDTKEIEPTDIYLNRHSVKLHLDEKLKLEAEVSPYDANYYSIHWSSSSPDIVFVDALGNIYGKSPGTAKVTVTTSNNIRDYCNVTVLADPETVSLPQQITLSKSQNVELIPTVLPQGCYDQLSWETSDSTLFTVADGVILPGNTGKGTLTAKTRNGLIAQSNIEILDPLFSFNVYRKDNTIDRYPFLDSPKVEYLDDKVIISSTRESKQITKDNIVKYTVSDLNSQGPSSVYLPQRISLHLQENVQLMPTIFPDYINYTGTMVWSSSDQDCVDVKDGEIIALKYGKSRITVTLENGTSASCEVEVLKPLYMTLWYADNTRDSYPLIDDPKVVLEGTQYVINDSRSIPVSNLRRITITNAHEANYPAFVTIPSEIVMNVYDKIQLDYNLLPSDSELENKPIWISSDTSIVDVSHDGIITGNHEGQAEIKVILDGGVCSTCEVTVSKPFYYLSVWLKDESIITFPFEHYPYITFHDGNYIIRSNNKELEISAEELLKYTINDFDISCSSSTDNDEDTIMPMSSDNVGLIQIYDLNGLLVHSVYSNSKQNYDISRIGLKKGIYIIKTLNTTIKMIKK